MKDKCHKIGIVMGSISDLEKVRPAIETLDQFGVEYTVAFVSAHRTPNLVPDYASAACRDGVRVIIAAAGLAAALAGALSSHVDIPVIGLPLGGGPVGGVDALLSVTNMPPGTPVAAVGINSAKNAALLALRILALADSGLQKRLSDERMSMAAQVLEQAKARSHEGLPVWLPVTPRKEM